MSMWGRFLGPGEMILIWAYSVELSTFFFASGVELRRASSYCWLDQASSAALAADGSRYWR